MSQGRVRDRGKTWFPELSDKRECIPGLVPLRLVTNKAGRVRPKLKVT